MVLHLASIAAVSVLMGLHTIPTDVGLPILTGLLGIGLPSPLKA